MHRRTATVAKGELPMKAATVMLALCALALGGVLSTRRPAASISSEALAASFDADMRRVVYEWNPDDTRPQAERLKALFDFVYQTYDASAWIPQSLFDMNLLTQTVVGDIDTIVGEKVGLVLWRDNARVPAFGMAPNAGADGPLRWT